MKLMNNTVLITGGTSGIGLALGRALMKLDNTVILLGKNPARLEAARKEGFEVIRCDLSKSEEIERASVHLQNHFPKLNLLFNNAGVQYNYDFTVSVIPLHNIHKEININLTGQMVLTQLLIPILSTSEKAFIVNTTSGLGAFPKLDALTYSASKAGLRNFTTGLRFALRDTGIKVLEIIPPVTETGMTEGRNENKMSAENLVKKVLPQLKKERKIITVLKMRLFLWIAFLFPHLAHNILSRD